MILGIDGSEQNANVCRYWLQFRCKSTLEGELLGIKNELNSVEAKPG
jgi:hypothetical protein